MSLVLRIFFGLNYLGGWILEYISLPYRPFYSTVFLLPAVKLQKMKILTVIAILIFAGSILVSAILNDTDYFSTIIYFRYFFLAIVIIGLSNRNLREVLNIRPYWLRGFIVLQLGVLIFQLIFAEQISANTEVSLITNDVRTGTFRLKGDPVLSAFFIVIVYYFLEFKSKSRKAWLFYFILPLIGVFLANSTLSKLVMLLLLAKNFLRFNFKLLFGLAIALVLIISQTDFYEDVIIPLSSVYHQFSSLSVSQDEMERFSEGGYGRIAAVVYYFDNWSLWGNGPGSSFDIITKEYVRGNTGQLFLFLDEIGLVGLTLSYFFVLAVCLQISPTRKIGYQLFIFLSIMTITTFPLSDVGLWFIILYVGHYFTDENDKIG